MMGSRRNRGFTLVELLTVVAILALLAVLAAPRIQSAGAAAKQARAKKELRTIQEALERHYADLGYYPRKLNELVTQGYIRPTAASDRDRFKSPTSKSYYFYAVDNNRNNQKPQAYVLGNPSPNAPSYTDDDAGANDLYPIGTIPQGRPPDERAWGWAAWQGNTLLNLYQKVPGTPPTYVLMDLGSVPSNLGNYRESCQTNTSEPTSNAPCDLIAN